MSAAVAPKKILMLGEHCQGYLRVVGGLCKAQRVWTTIVDAAAAAPVLSPSRAAVPSPAGGTRFIGVYLARMLIDQGHEVTLLTRGKKPVTYRIPDDTGAWDEGAAGAATRLRSSNTPRHPWATLCAYSCCTPAML